MSFRNYVKTEAPIKTIESRLNELEKRIKKLEMPLKIFSMRQMKMAFQSSAQIFHLQKKNYLREIYHHVKDLINGKFIVKVKLLNEF